MNKVIASVLGSVLAISLSAGAFAGSSIGQVTAVDDSGIPTSAPVVTFDTEGFHKSRHNAVLDFGSSEMLTAYVPHWSLGELNNSANGGLSIVNVDGGFGVSLADASSRTAADKLDFMVTAPAGTARGSYVVLVTLENADHTEQSIVTIDVSVY